MALARRDPLPAVVAGAWYGVEAGSRGAMLAAGDRP